MCTWWTSRRRVGSIRRQQQQRWQPVIVMGKPAIAVTAEPPTADAQPPASVAAGATAPPSLLRAYEARAAAAQQVQRAQMAAAGAARTAAQQKVGPSGSLLGAAVPAMHPEAALPPQAAQPSAAAVDSRYAQAWGLLPPLRLPPAPQQQGGQQGGQQTAQRDAKMRVLMRHALHGIPPSDKAQRDAVLACLGLMPNEARRLLGLKLHPTAPAAPEPATAAAAGAQAQQQWQVQQLYQHQVLAQQRQQQLQHQMLAQQQQQLAAQRLPVVVDLTNEPDDPAPCAAAADAPATMPAVQPQQQQHAAPQPPQLAVPQSQQQAAAAAVFPGIVGAGLAVHAAEALPSSLLLEGTGAEMVANRQKRDASVLGPAPLSPRSKRPTPAPEQAPQQRQQQEVEGKASLASGVKLEPQQQATWATPAGTVAAPANGVDGADVETNEEDEDEYIEIL